MRNNKVILRAVLVYAAYVLVSGLLQTTWPTSFTIMGAQPDLTLILAILCGYMFGQRDGMAVGLAAGFLRDMLAGRVLGLGMLLLMYAALYSAAAFKKFFRRNIMMSFIHIVVVTIVYEIIIVALTFALPMVSGVSYQFADLFSRMLTRLPWVVLVNLIASLPMVFLLNYLGPYKRGPQSDDPDEAIDWR